MERPSDTESGIPLLPINHSHPSHSRIPSPAFTEGSDGRRSRSPGQMRITSAQSRSIADEYAFLTPAETAARLETSLTHGQTSAEGLSRLQRDGPNEIPHDPPEPLWLRFIGRGGGPRRRERRAAARAAI